MAGVVGVSSGRLSTVIARQCCFRANPGVRAISSSSALRQWPIGATNFALIQHPHRQPNSKTCSLQCTRIGAVRSASTDAGAPLKQTPLYDLHVKNGATMVPFGGYDMPVQYSDLSISESHNWTREKASLFDVSHMVQHSLKGPGAQGLLEKLTPAGLESVPDYHGSLSCFLHPSTGGIVDDTIITRLGPDEFYFVTNAACRDKDLAYLQENIQSWHEAGNPKVEWNILDERGLIALQGPLSVSILEPLITDLQDNKLENFYFGQCKYMNVRLPNRNKSSPLLVSRGGYTGEDGFEISVPISETQAVTQHLLTSAGPEKLRLAGLGARDSLRLEAGMCLYGHDLDDTTTPIEAGLAWVVGKDRRTGGGFNGSEVILQQIKPKKEGGSGTTRRRIGLIVDKAPAREGAEIVNSEGNSVGKITSGCPSPTMKKNIAMGYVKTGYNKAGTELSVLVRGKPRKAVVTKMPFVPSKYWKGGSSPG